MQDDSNKDDSSVWSSYSDLFTNVAIIFLVMFVFALIKSGVNQIEQAQMKRKHESELKGKLSKKEMDQNQKRISDIQKKVEEMKEYENIIDSKVQELNTYAKKLQENKDVLKTVIESQLKQDQLLKTAQETIEKEKEERAEKEIALQEAQLRINLLNDELERMNNDVRQKEDILNQKIEQKNAQAKSREEKLKNLVAANAKENEKRIETLKNEITEIKEESSKIITQKERELTHKIQTLDQQLVNAKDQARTLANELTTKKNESQSQVNLVNNLQQQFSQLERQLKANEQAREKLKFEKEMLHTTTQIALSQNEQLRKDHDALKRNLGKAEGQGKGLSERLHKLENQLRQSETLATDWKKAYENKLNEANQLMRDLTKSQKSFSELAKTMSALKDSVKNDVTNKLISKFKENNLSAQVNKKTGEVVLLSGEGFNFEKGSAKLSSEGKSILKKIIPVYTAVLFEDQKIVNQLASVNMEGHSSPSFGGKYVSPEDQNTEAYAFNLRLSAMRAASVAQYLMGNEIGDYPFKSKMKTYLQAVGFGYMKPIMMEPSVQRGPASLDPASQDCGPWDCGRSQRVQINFLLKDNLEEIHKIIDSNGGIR
jgi:chromosome segregation ATPase